MHELHKFIPPFVFFVLVFVLLCLFLNICSVSKIKFIAFSQFSLEFLALNTGSSIVTGGNIWTEESVEVTNGTGAVTGSPLAISSQTIYGWVTKEDGTVERVTFAGGQFTLADGSYNGTVCVRYYNSDAAARTVTINADMLPSTIRLVMEGTLASSDATTNKIGTVQIEVPRASMTGAFTLSMTPDAVSQTPLSVRALASNVQGGGCNGNHPIYATISEAKSTEKIDGANWYDNVIALAIEGGDFEIAKNATKTLQVYAIKNDGSAAFLAPIAGLTFSSDKSTIATADGGIVTGMAAGSATIKATITEKTEIDANIVVTVTA